MKRLFLTVLFFMFFIISFLSILLQPGAVFAKTQRIFLSPGWNLISLQLEPYNNDPAAVFADLISEGRFLAIWAYDAASVIWSTWQYGDNDILNTLTGVVLTGIHANQGYWLKVSDYAELEVNGEVGSGILSFQPGWNLVGFAGFLLQNTDEQDISSVFLEKIEKVDEIWGFDPASGKFLGHDLTAEPKRIDFIHLVPGKGYWVKARESFSLSPQLGLSLEGDIDVPPLRTQERPFPQPEDEDLNEDGFYDTPQTQDTISFRKAVTIRYLTITNRGEGTLNWEIQEDIPWLSLDQNNYGITTTETDFVGAIISRDGMIPGLYTGTLNLVTQGQTRSIHVKMIVPEIDGDYEGRAVVYSVNGKPANIASVDLALSLFKDQEGFLRGIIDSEKTLLFPFDVSLSGCYYETGTNHLIVSGAFILHPGPDINNPPFDIFPDANDIDANGNGVEDIENPFLFDITREITLLGDRTKEGLIEGKYFEVLRGALPEPITMEGYFSFERVSFKPTKKTPFNYYYTEDTYIPSLLDTEITLTVEEPILIDAIEVYLEVEHESLSDLTISLISPSGKEVILHDQTAGQDIETTYPTQALPSEDLGAFKGEMAPGEWTLIIRDAVEDIEGWLRQWRLSIHGTPVYQVSGTVSDAQTGQGLSGANLILTGSPVIQSINTDEDGYYIFGLLSSGHYLMNVSKPGYNTHQQSIWVEQNDLIVPDIALEPINVTEASLRAAPLVGTSSQEVRLIAMLPSGTAQPGDICLWYFGDGQTDTKEITDNPNIIEIKHTYTSAGAYSAGLSITDASQTQERIFLTTREDILIYPVHGESDRPYIFQWAFSGGGAEENESAADSASFDIDRPPYRTETDFPGPEDTDHTDDPARPPNGKYDVYTSDPEEGPARFRIITNIGAQFTGACVARDKRLYTGPSGLL